MNKQKVITEQQQDNKGTDEPSSANEHQSIRYKKSVSVSIQPEEYQLKDLQNTVTLKQLEKTYDTPYIQFEDTIILEGITKIQILRAINGLFTICGNTLNTPIIIVIDIIDEMKSIPLLRQLGQDIHNLKENNTRLKKKLKPKPKIVNKCICLVFLTKTISFYVNNWYMSPVSFALATIIGNLLDTSIKDRIVTYTDEPTKPIDSRCIIEGLVNAQELIDDAYRQGILSHRFLISKDTASKLINDMIKNNSTNNAFLDTFQTKVRFLNRVTPCKCQYCKYIHEYAHHNLERKLVNIKVQVGTLVRGIENLMRGDTDHPVYERYPITGYFINIFPPPNSSISTLSCNACPLHKKESSEVKAVIAITSIIYIMGIAFLPFVSLVVYSIKKLIGYRS